MSIMSCIWYGNLRYADFRWDTAVFFYLPTIYFRNEPKIRAFSPNTLFPRSFKLHHQPTGQATALAVPFKFKQRAWKWYMWKTSDFDINLKLNRSINTAVFKITIRALWTISSLWIFTRVARSQKKNFRYCSIKRYHLSLCKTEILNDKKMRPL